MIDDAELLHRYAGTNSEEAFAEFVQRNIGLVYSAALRRMGGDAHAAADVTQQVFVAAARRARELSRHGSLTGWLYSATRNAAINLMRGERRRQVREREAQVASEKFTPAEAPPDWDRLRPVLDAAMDELNDADREAVLLRFFANLPFADVGAKLRVTENTARMRVERALEKLQAPLARRGVTSTAVALATVLAEQAAAAVPTGLAATVTGTALADTVGSGATAVAFMSASKITAGLAGLVAAAAAVGFFVQYQANAQLRGQLDVLNQQGAELALLRAENSRLTKTQAEQNAELDSLRAVLAGLPEPGRQVAGAGVNSPGGAGAAASVAVEGNGTGTGYIVQGATLEGRYATLFKELGLDPGRLDKFKNLLLAKRHAAEDAVDALLQKGVNPSKDMEATRGAVAAAQATVNDQIQEELGNDGYVRYRSYEATLPQRNTIEQLEQLLGPSPAPLTGDQVEQMIALLEKSHEPEGKGGTGRLLDGNLNYHSKISAQTISMAAGVLTPPQVEMLKHLQDLQHGGTVR